VREVVITGLGIVSPIGVGRDEVWQSLSAKRSGVRPIAELAAANWIAPWGGEVRDFEPKEYIQPRKSIKVMSREIQLASAAAEMAWQDAGLAEANVDPERFGAIGAAGLLYCELEELHQPFKSWINQEDFDIEQWSKLAMGEMYPLWMLKYLPNMPACHIGIRYDARGPNNTIAEGEVSSLLAVAEGAEMIRRDLCDVVVVGGTGSRINITDIMWHAGARVSRDGSVEPAAVCRPFDLNRSGMVYGEGAAELVLESRDHAERRGVRPIARIAAAANRYEPSAETLLPTGDAIRRAILAAMASAKLESFHIGHVNAHGNSTLEDDRAEAQAIRSALGDVPVTALKSFFGNLGHGSGMVELAVDLIAFANGVIPPTLNYTTPDPECPVSVVTDARPIEQKSFVKLNHNATGQAAAVVVSGF
jgi:3-oxoacyl-[acyl-carrier-protein] synthase II